MENEDFNSYFVFRYIYITEIMGIEYDFDTYIETINLFFDEKTPVKKIKENLIQAAIETIEKNMFVSRTDNETIIKMRFRFNDPAERIKMVFAFLTSKDENPPVDLLLGNSRYNAKAQLKNIRRLYQNIVNSKLTSCSIQDLFAMHLQRDQDSFYEDAESSLLYYVRLLTGGKRKTRKQKHRRKKKRKTIRRKNKSC
jgi:hypothetical protein